MTIMKPYSFIHCIMAHTKESCTQRDMGFYFARAKAVLKHLESLGWNDSDIRFVIPQIVKSLCEKGTIPTYPYICGILLNTSESPSLSSEENTNTSGYENWIENEIKRISK